MSFTFGQASRSHVLRVVATAGVAALSALLLLMMLAPADAAAPVSADSWKCSADYRNGPNVVVTWDLVDNSTSEWIWQYDIAHNTTSNVVFGSHGSWTTFDDTSNTLPDSTPEPYWLTSYRVDGTSETYPCKILRPKFNPRGPVLMGPAHY